MNEIVIPPTEHSPTLRVHVNPLYNLYHHLAKRLPVEQRHPALAETARIVALARFPIGAHGAWDSWERPIARGGDLDTAVGGMKAAMLDSAERIGAALRRAETIYRDTIWPGRLPSIEAALATIREQLAPHFPAMVRAQGTALGLAFPPEIEAYLVADCYDWRGGYSDPLTLDATLLRGLDLCETVIHEATHVADVHTKLVLGSEGMGDRLQAHLVNRGLTRGAWDVWHAVIFASSAGQVKTFIDPDHRDYALTHNSPDNNLYSWFNVPNLPTLWAAFASGATDEQAFFDAVAGERSAAGAPARPELA